MTPKELLIPRFQVIADYPEPKNHPYYAINEIITCNTLKDESYFSKYPHLFNKLNWWEYRKVQDMPKRLICKAIENDTEVLYIEEWDMTILVGWTNKAERKGCNLHSFKPEYGYFPFD